MLSEFSSDRYTAAQSKKFLDSFSISQGTEYIWFGVGILLAYYLLFTMLNGMALHFIRYEKYKGVTVKAAMGDADKDGDVYVEVNTPGASSVAGQERKVGGLSFTPSNLCIKDLEYFVTLPSGEEKQLLCGITAHFEPGRMVALMGATGAGKTTLMDVIAGRKTGGRIVGDIIVNGEPKNPANFSRITAYCEQMDIHSEAATIYEALVFSANLRLPPTFTKEERMNLVLETLDLLELTTISGEMRGGFTAYFGDLGVDSVKMLEYFASIPGTMEIHPQYNPATYMLEVIGAGIGRDVKDYSIEYKNSELYKSNRERTLQLAQVSDEFVRHSTLNYNPIATGFANQLGQLAKKQQLTYWRNPQYNFMP
ncbi:hypothetical protein PRIC1_011999 [Phytophthora ramorum]